MSGVRETIDEGELRLGRKRARLGLETIPRRNLHELDPLLLHLGRIVRRTWAWASRILPRVDRIPGNIRRRDAFAGPLELARFFKGARLETMPAKMPERTAVLAYVAEAFEPGRDYAEAEVNVMLARVQDDFATLRRYLIDAGLLRRERGTYRRA